MKLRWSGREKILRNKISDPIGIVLNEILSVLVGKDLLPLKKTNRHQYKIRQYHKNVVSNKEEEGLVRC